MGNRIDGATARAFAVDGNSPDTVTVKMGDTLQSIADRNGVDLRDLMVANGITDPKQVFLPGQELKVPTKSYAAPPSETHENAARPGSSGVPLGDPIAASAMKAQLNAESQVAPQSLPVDEQVIKAKYGDEGLRTYQAEKKEKQEYEKLPSDEKFVVDTQGKAALPAYRKEKQEVHDEYVQARHAYETTGKVPPNLEHWAPIEIENGGVMTRAERYDANLKQQGLPASHERMDDVNVDPKYLSREEHLEEWKSRAHKEMEPCEEYTRPGTKYKCKMEVAARYGGPNYVAEQNAERRDRIQKTGEYSEALKSSGPIGLAGRAVGRTIGWSLGDADKGEQWGAVLTGPADAASMAYGAARGQAYQPQVVNQTTVTHNEPPPRNAEETQPGKRGVAESSPAPKTPVDPWAETQAGGDVVRQGDVGQKVKALDEEIWAERQRVSERKDGMSPTEWNDQRAGATKHLYNLLETRAALIHAKTWPDRTYLVQARVVGVEQNGVLTETNKISSTGKGRIPDTVELNGDRVVLEDLKSPSTQVGSVKGGVKRPGEIEGEFKSTSEIGKQHQVEHEVIENARKNGGKIVIEGTDVMTGATRRIVVAPTKVSSRVTDYNSLPNN